MTSIVCDSLSIARALIFSVRFVFLVLAFYFTAFVSPAIFFFSYRNYFSPGLSSLLSLLSLFFLFFYLSPLRSNSFMKNGKEEKEKETR